MPITRCSKDGKPGWKWGESGACYIYTPGNAQSEARAKAKAGQQQSAIKMNQAIRRRAGRS